MRLTLLVDVFKRKHCSIVSPSREMALSGWVCLVTGASRGIGKGIALQLSEAGATVYITGRQEKTLKQTAAEVGISSLGEQECEGFTFFQRKGDSLRSWLQVQQRGGKCVPVICDSTKPDDIEELFGQIKREQQGRLDMLVNNAYAGVQVARRRGSAPALSHSSNNTETFRVECRSRISLTTWGKSSGRPSRPCGTRSTTLASGTSRWVWPRRTSKPVAKLLPTVYTRSSFQ